MDDECPGCGYNATVEDQVAAAIIFVTAGCGVGINMLITLTTGRLPMLRNSFGTLLRFQSGAETIFLAIWAFYFAPALFLNIDTLKSFNISRRMGQLCLICYDVSIYSHLSISINRFVSLYFPTEYSFIFNDYVTRWIIAVICGLSLTFSFLLPAGGCNMIFSNAKWMLDYHATCNLTLLYYAEFLRAVIVITAIFCINAATYLKMHMHHQRNYPLRAGASNVELGLQQKRRLIEKNFVRQVCIQGFAYVTELLTYFLVSLAFPQQWPNFILTTWAWIMVHTVDGFITLIFNRQFRKILFPKDDTNYYQNGGDTSSKVITLPAGHFINEQALEVML
ncbi:unnamed protein product, partial [Mesorhabditis spiculigera]